MIDGRTVQVGGPALLRELDLTETDAMAATTRQWAGRGAAVLHVVDGDRILGAVSLEDAIRPESRQAVKALQARGIKVALITGDARQVADAVGPSLASTRSSPRSSRPTRTRRSRNCRPAG